MEKLKETKDYAVIRAMNNHIGKVLDFQPEVEWCVGLDDGTTCYSPKDIGYRTPDEQKRACERYLEEQRIQYPNGWVIKDGYKAIKIEWYPFFHNDWNSLIKAVKRLKQKEGLTINLTLDIDTDFEHVYTLCC